MLYFDTSFVAPIVLTEPSTEAVQRYIRSRLTEDLEVSHLTRLELSSTLAREVRMRSLSPQQAAESDAGFEALIQKSFNIITPNDQDFERAKSYIRNYATGLRAPDALHLAIAANRNATQVLTLDKGLLKAGRLLGLPMSSGPIKG